MFLSPKLCLGYMNRQTQVQALETHIFYNFRVGQGALACFVFVFVSRVFIFPSG